MDISSLQFWRAVAVDPRATGGVDDGVDPGQNRNVQEGHIQTFIVITSSKGIFDKYFHTNEARNARVPDPRPSRHTVLVLLGRHDDFDRMQCGTFDFGRPVNLDHI